MDEFRRIARKADLSCAHSDVNPGHCCAVEQLFRIFSTK